jgi:hypothetical protein
MKNFLAAITFSVSVCVILSPTALAQDDEVTYKERTEIDFEGVEVAGELVKPQGALLLERKRASFNPLIKLRTDFNPEMSQSVNNVK